MLRVIFKSLELGLTIRTNCYSDTLFIYLLDHQKAEKIYMYTFTDGVLTVSYLRKLGIDNLYYLLKTNKNKGTKPAMKLKKRLNGTK